jgi:signal transduction histidine kinase
MNGSDQAGSRLAAPVPGARVTSTDGSLAHLLVMEDIPTHSGEVVELLAARGYRMARVATSDEAVARLRQDRPALVVVIDHDDTATHAGPAAAVRAAAKGLGIPVLAVVEDLGDPGQLAARLTEVDDWVSIAGAASELPVRVARLLERSAHDGSGPLFGRRFLSMVVHDLRTPLNVIGLSLRIIGQSLPATDPEVQEDLTFLEENFQVLVRMLHQLSDFHRLFERTASPEPVAFDPRRLVGDFVTDSQAKGRPKATQVDLTVDASCPTEVSLDPVRARLALEYAVANASGAARQDAAVRIVLRGEHDRWITEVIVDHAPPPTVAPVVLAPNLFERICGTDAERRGVDLAITAMVSALFGGSARLEVRPGQGTSVVLDWPTHLPPPA